MSDGLIYFPPFSYIKEIWDQRLLDRHNQGNNPFKFTYVERVKYQQQNISPNESGIFYPYNYHVAIILIYQGQKFICRLKDERSEFLIGPDHTILNPDFGTQFRLRINHAHNDYCYQDEDCRRGGAAIKGEYGNPRKIAPLWVWVMPSPMTFVYINWPWEKIKFTYIAWADFGGGDCFDGYDLEYLSDGGTEPEHFPLYVYHQDSLKYLTSQILMNQEDISSLPGDLREYIDRLKNYHQAKKFILSSEAKTISKKNGGNIY